MQVDEIECPDCLRNSVHGMQECKYTSDVMEREVGGMQVRSMRGESELTWTVNTESHDNAGRDMYEAGIIKSE